MEIVTTTKEIAEYGNIVQLGFIIARGVFWIMVFWFAILGVIDRLPRKK